MRILLLSRIFEDSILRLAAEHDVIRAYDASAEEHLDLITDRDALVFRSGVDVTRDLMSRAPDLRLLIRAGSGLDNIDLDYVQEKGLELIRVPGLEQERWPNSHSASCLRWPGRC